MKRSLRTIFWPDLTRRNSEAIELMDLAGSCGWKLRNTLRCFSLTNLLFSSSRRLLRDQVIGDMLSSGGKARTLVDLGSGSCDIARGLARTARRLELALTIYCIDRDKRVVDFARSVSKDGAIRIICDDALNFGAHVPEPDYVFSTHLLHHLGEGEVERLFDAVAVRCRRKFIIEDLCRSRVSHFAMTVFSPLFGFTFAPVDGPVSMTRAFTVGELKRLTAGLGDGWRVQVNKAAVGHLYILGEKVRK